jgi:hypothetical protein
MAEVTMLVITTLSIVALAATYGLSRLRADGEERLANPHGEIMTVGVQIICGDCSGDGDHPVKTYLDRLGKCGQCGGRSYVLASVCGRYRIIGLAPDRRNATEDGRRQLYGTRAGVRAARVRSLSF